MPEDGAQRAREVENARQVNRQVAPRLRAYPNVTGVGVGYKIVQGRRTDTISIRVYVRRKLPPQELAPTEILP